MKYCLLYFAIPQLPDQKGVGHWTFACLSASFWTLSNSARQPARLSISIRNICKINKQRGGRGY